MQSEDQFLTKVSGFIQENKLIKSGDTVLVGFSGGPDSTALLHSLTALRIVFQCTLLAAHINYNLRGEESNADMEFAKKFCFQLGISIVIKEVVLTSKSDLENEARRIRFDYFNTLSKTYRIDKIALGHNKNDVVETMLLHLFRGAGITGMKGIMPLNNNIIRPLLCCDKQEILDYLCKMKIDNWRQDSSNKSNIFSRNKLRNSIIPWLEENINNKLIDVMYENSLIFKETDEYLRRIADNLLKKAIVNHSMKEIRLDLRELHGKNPVILYYLFRGVINIIKGKEIGFYHKHFQEICSILTSKGCKKIILPDRIIVHKEYQHLLFTTEIEQKKLSEAEDRARQVIDVTKKYHLFGNRRIEVRRMKMISVKKSFYEERNIALLDADKIILPLEVGYREEGDRFIPLGMNGTKKLKDFFIDEKFSKFERGRVLIFRDNEKIIWITGLRIDDRAKIEQKTKNVLLLKVENIMIRSRRSVPRKKNERG